MAINSEHPFYEEFKQDWITMRDLYRGERVVKRRGVHYLPATSGMHLDGMGHDNLSKPKPGQRAYDAYLARAYFSDLVKEGVEALIGMMHQKPATFELPPQMEPLVEKCTLQGEGLQDLLRRINTEQLTQGRIGLLADLPVVPLLPVAGQDAMPIIPYIAWYITESIINWDEADTEEGYHALNLVVLNESGFKRQDDFTWKNLMKYRILTLGDTRTDEPNSTGAPYRMGTFTDTQGANNIAFNEDAMKAPILRGVELDEIPFVFINTKDICATPDDPPLLGLGKLALAIYRGDADYRQTLFMSGQDTLVVVGGTQKRDGTNEDDALRTGAGARIDVEMGGDAKYIGITANGITEMRNSLENDRNLASQKAGRLVQSGPAKQDESGEALKTRITAQTATLNQIAVAGAKGLENLLKIIGKWMGLGQPVLDKIKVTPNLEFADFALVAQDIVQLMTARGMGAPISRESIHAIMVDRGMTQMSFEDELDKIEEENANMPPSPGTAGGPNPLVDPHLTNEDGTPMNKDELQQASEKRAAAREKQSGAADK